MNLEEAKNLIKEKQNIEEQIKELQRKLNRINKEIKDNEVWICSICGEVQVDTLKQNNAYPVQKEPCCDACNLHHVIPARIKQNGGWY